MSLSQIELFDSESKWNKSVFEWIGEKITKVSESKMAVSESNMYKMAESKMAEFKMAPIIKLNENEWVKLLLCKWWEPILASMSKFERKY